MTIDAQKDSTPIAAAAATSDRDGTTRREVLALLAGAATAPWWPATAPAAESGSAAARLRALLDASEAASNRLDPMPRNLADRRPGDPVFVDPLGDAYRAARERNARRDLDGLATIPRAELAPVEQIAYDVLEYRARRELEKHRAGLARVAQLAPLNASSGLHVQLPDYVSGAGAPFASVADYDAGLQRLEGFATYVRSIVARLQEGSAGGYVQSRVVAAQVRTQVADLLAVEAAKSPFLAALGRMPQSFTPRERARYERAYRAAFEKRVRPAYVALLEYLDRDYLARATEATGRGAMRDGDRLYADELRYHTTLATTPEQVHATGLEEVAKIRASMEAVRTQVGFSGDLLAMFEYVRTDPQFYYTKPEELLARFASIETRIWEGMPRLFARRPKAPFAVRPLPGVGSQRGTGYYRPGPPDGVTPGVLYFNMDMLKTRPIPTLETLTLHEGIPGHHYQVTLVLEDASLPPLLRFGGLTAYSEGWALYAESLGRELGMFGDPWQWFGHLDMAMLRAVRLVVDTGMHALGWTRQRAIDYMLANTSMAQRDVQVEIDRYLSMPGQACAYKPGELEIRALRTRAEAAFGARFDVRAFHSQVLDTGALPLAVLRAKLERWIATA